MQSFDRDLLIILHDDRADADQVRSEGARNSCHDARSVRSSRVSTVNRACLRTKWPPSAKSNRSPSRLVNRLEMVERRPDPTHRRIKRLHLLPAAKPILETINEARELMNARITAGLDEKMRNTLIDALLVIKENLANEALTGVKLAAAGE